MLAQIYQNNPELAKYKVDEGNNSSRRTHTKKNITKNITFLEVYFIFDDMNRY